MFLKESAVDLLADVLAGKVNQVVQRTATYAINGRTGRRCTKPMNGLAAAEAVTVGDDGRYELTADGEEALFWYRPGLRPSDGERVSALESSGGES